MSDVKNTQKKRLSKDAAKPRLRSTTPPAKTRRKFPLSPNPLPQTFFNRPTLSVAKELLGKYLICDFDDSPVIARIVDVEAYIGQDDLACHASKGRTKRTEVLFGPAGMTYVYLIYGMYDLLNVVTEKLDFPAAILIRGIEVFSDTPDSPIRRIDGPGRLTRFLNITRSHNQLDATLGQSLWIEDHQEKISKKQIQASPRIGVDYACEWAKKLWRFSLPSPPEDQSDCHSSE